MRVVRRPVALFAAAAAAAVVIGGVLGATTHSDAAPAGTATAGDPKVPNAVRADTRTFLRPGDQLHSGDSRLATLTGGGLGAGPQNMLVTVSPYTLVLQDDGNLVEYRTERRIAEIVWSSGTHATTPTTLTFQTDGNLVLRNQAGKALWATGTAGRPAAYFDVYGNGQLLTQDAVGRVVYAFGRADVGVPGFVVDRAVSPGIFTESGPFRRLAVQADGNLVLYADTTSHPKVLWTTSTSGVGPVRLAAQSDGNLVLRQLSTGRAVWTSGTHGPTAYYQLDVQDDGNLVLYRTDGVRRLQAVWASGTHA